MNRHSINTYAHVREPIPTRSNEPILIAAFLEGVHKFEMKSATWLLGVRDADMAKLQYLK